MAIRENAMDVFDVLVNEPKIDIEATSANGDTALMIACFLANEPAVLTLLKRDAQINRPGWVPLHYAAASGSVEIVKLLLDRSAYIDAASPNATTPLMMAARGGKFDVVKLLVDEGADKTLKNQQGLDAADFATLGKSTEIAAWLKARPTPSPNQSPTPTPNATQAPADKQ
jgi:ankyrin repeat protein